MVITLPTIDQEDDDEDGLLFVYLLINIKTE